jgi:hypothetical protein
MSIQAQTWAYAQSSIKQSSVKFVLVTLANFASEHGLCFPSIECICAQTALDRKTVISALATLQSERYMIDTGERRGRTGQVKVYRLLCSAKHSETGTLNKKDQPKPQANEALAQGDSEKDSETGTVPKSAAKRTVFPRKESRFSVERVPKTEHGTVREPSEEPSGNHHGPLAQPDRASMDVEFQQIRKAYPTRANRHRWPDAEKHYRARRREGATFEQILDGVKRYAECMKSEGVIGTNYVMQAATFLGTNRGFEEDWNPDITPQPASKLKWRPSSDDCAEDQAHVSG